MFTIGLVNNKKPAATGHLAGFTHNEVIMTIMQTISQIKSEVVLVTPAMAEQWLKSNTKNRKPAERTINAYASDMAAGRWELTNQGIAFYETGELADGQHRLMAVIKSRTPVMMMVTYGLSESAINGIDQHKIRAVHDVLTMASHGQVTSIDVAVTRLCFGYAKSTASIVGESMLLIIDELRQVDDWMVKTNTKLVGACTRAAIVLALKAGADKEKIRSFTAVLTTGMPNCELDRGVIVLRESLLSGATKQRGGAERVEIVKKVQQAIKNYIDGRVVSRSLTPTEYVYPILSLGDAK